MSALGLISPEELREALWPASDPPATRIVACRHCGRRNRVLVARAVTDFQRHQCGFCRARLFLGREEALVGLASEAYQHSMDRRSLAALRSLPGLPELIRWVLEHVGDRAAQMMFMADSIRCSHEQFPELVAMVTRARLRLDLDFEPIVYLGESPYMNALTTGVRTPVIVVQSALLDQMNDDQLLAVLGHELGHLHADHPLYQSVAKLLLYGGASASSVIRLFGLPIQRALLRWLRHAELTADRAALLVCRDLGACISTMFTFAGGNRPGTASRTQLRMGPFIRQCRELANMQARHALDGLLGGYMTMDRTHPHVATRVMALIQWVEHGNYLNILGGHYLRHSSRHKHLPPRAAPANPPPPAET